MPSNPTEAEDIAAHREHPRKVAARLLAAAMSVALFLLVHTYGISLLPSHHRILSPEQVEPDTAHGSFGYNYHFQEGIPDRVREMRSRLIFMEDGRPHTIRTTSEEEIATVGGDRYVHLPDRVFFSTIDNSDPRTNGRIYSMSWPWLYSNTVGRASAAMFGLGLIGLWWLGRRKPPQVVAAPIAVEPGRWLWWIALVVFAAGLYCSTGTRAPYGITFGPAHVDPATGFIYNQDHVHFKVLFDFVDGQPRAVWDRALLLRRILYPILSWPAMKLLGFEAGGVTMNLLLNLAAFVGATFWLRRRMGGRAGVMGAWLLAAYPGFAYWVGMPYQYALIAPGALLLTIALAEIADSGSRRRTLVWALVMGVMYLAYDFAPVFLPASLALLAWRRRWLDTGAVAVAGILPLLVWLLLLRLAFGQSLENANTGVYRSVLGIFLGQTDWAQWLAGLGRVWDTAATAYLGANFIFLPALFLGVLAVNSCTARVRLADSETAILGATVLLFAAINLGPDSGGTWNMSGSWIARLYQPVFPVMIFFIARWWQSLPELRPSARPLLLAGLALVTGGNLLVVFGPITGNPLHVSGDAFFRFYTHSSTSRMPPYENCLRDVPARTLGFGRPVNGRP